VDKGHEMSDLFRQGCIYLEMLKTEVGDVQLGPAVLLVDGWKALNFAILGREMGIEKVWKFWGTNGWEPWSNV
jgi:hypothetical protein